MSELFNAVFYQPILAALVFIYDRLAFGDLGLAIVLLTVGVRIVLFPIFYKGAKDQTIVQRLQPEIKKIQKEHKDNKEKQVQAILALYREHRFNPLSSFFLIVVQLPVFIALFQIFSKEIVAETFANRSFLGLINLGEKSFVVVAVAALLQYWQGKLSLSLGRETAGGLNRFASTSKMMVLLGPLFTFMIFANLPSALGLYFAVSNVFSIIQPGFINKKLNSQNHGKNNSKTENNY